MIDIATERMLSLAEAAKMLPAGRQGRPVNHSTIFRWVLKGVRTQTGVLVRLDALRLGSKWVTSVEALQRFALAQTPDLAAEQRPTRTPTARQRASAAASKQLERMGI